MNNRSLFSLKAIRILLGLKLLFAMGILLVVTDQITFEEKDVSAQAPDSDSTKGSATDADQSENSDDAESGTSALVAQTTVDDENYGILEGLLDLPPLKKDGKESLGKYLTLADRARQQADDRIKILQNRAESLREVEKVITAKLAKLEKERGFFLNTIQQEKKIQEDRLEALVELYAKMEPKKAGPVLEQMDKDLVVALFNKLKRKQVTAFLENMAPDKSVEITEYFGRIGSAREYDLLKEVNRSLQEAFDKCKTP